MKIRPQAKIDNFSFEISNIIIEGVILKRKDYLPWKKFQMQKNNALNKFYFYPNFFFIASNQILKNYVILINQGSFFQEKESSQLYHFQLMEINSSMAETIKNQFSKKKSYKQTA